MSNERLPSVFLQCNADENSRTHGIARAIATGRVGDCMKNIFFVISLFGSLAFGAKCDFEKIASISPPNLIGDLDEVASRNEILGPDFVYITAKLGEKEGRVRKGNQKGTRLLEERLKALGMKPFRSGRNEITFKVPTRSKTKAKALMEKFPDRKFFVRDARNEKLDSSAPVLDLSYVNPSWKPGKAVTSLPDNLNHRLHGLNFDSVIMGQNLTLKIGKGRNWEDFGFRVIDVKRGEDDKVVVRANSNQAGAPIRITRNADGTVEMNWELKAGTKKLIERDHHEELFKETLQKKEEALEDLQGRYSYR